MADRAGWIAPPQTLVGGADRRYRPVLARRRRLSPSIGRLAPGAFAAPLADPRGRDVVVTVSRDLPGFGPNVRATMALGIVEFLEQDKGLIEQEMSASSATAGG